MTLVDSTPDLTISEDDTDIRKYYKQIYSKINEIDETIYAGTEGATKRKFTNELVNNYKDEWEKPATFLAEQMESFDEEKLAGAFYGLVRFLSDKYKTKIDEWITNQVESQPKEDTPEVSENEKKQLATTRSELLKQLKALVDIANTVGESDPENPWPMPKRRGAVGKRGKRALSLYHWRVDGVDLSAEEDSTKGVASRLGMEGARDFVKALKEVVVSTNEEGTEVKFDTRNPPEEFAVTINDHVVEGVREEESEEEEDEDVTQPETDD